MRFEIRGGGVAAILIAVTLLSGAVFVLGLLAGYDVGRQARISSADVATAYPLRPPEPAASASPPANFAAAAPPANANPRSTNIAASTTNVSAPAVPPPARMRPASVPPREMPSGDRMASTNAGAPIPASTPPPPPRVEAPQPASPSMPPERSAALESPRNHRRPYNIQIQAAMDLGGANQMMRRLRQLGYSPHLVPTDIGGARWYKVEVGPYSTQEEAAAAEAQLRQKYNATYGGGSQPAQPADSDADSE